MASFPVNEPSLPKITLPGNCGDMWGVAWPRLWDITLLLRRIYAFALLKPRPRISTLKLSLGKLSNLNCRKKPTQDILVVLFPQHSFALYVNSRAPWGSPLIDISSRRTKILTSLASLLPTGLSQPESPHLSLSRLIWSSYSGGLDLLPFMLIEMLQKLLTGRIFRGIVSCLLRNMIRNPAQHAELPDRGTGTANIQLLNVLEEAWHCRSHQFL